MQITTYLLCHEVTVNTNLNGEWLNANKLMLNVRKSNYVIFHLKYIYSQIFENQPNEICSHSSEKASKGMFLKPKKLQNTSNEGKGKEKKNERANVIKNPAKYKIK